VRDDLRLHAACRGGRQRIHASDYENLEALVVYEDGTSEVRTYGDKAELATGLKALKSEENVACVQPNYSCTTSSDSDPLYADQWALNNDGSFELETNQNDYPVFDSPFGEPSPPQNWNGPARQSTMARASFTVTAVSGVDVNAEEAWDIYDGGSRDVIVALIDTGVTGLVGDTSHARIMSLKVLGGEDGEGTTADIIKAIEYAEANGASIVNLSLGGSYFDYALYQTMKNSDMLFVVAAGNDGTDSDQTPCYPASFNLSNIIAVANLDCDGTLSDSSNYGASSVDIAAPGSYILSTTTDNSYSYMTGTSMATPLVTAAAMVYSYDTDATLSQVRQILLDSASEQSSLSGKVSSGGMLDVAAALEYDLSDELLHGQFFPGA
jgi:subtilisin family serine protease